MDDILFNLFKYFSCTIVLFTYTSDRYLNSVLLILEDAIEAMVLKICT